MVEEPRYADFARRLKEAMASKELTVTHVKDELKITYEMARRYTLGIAMPRDERMRKLADFVGRTAAYLQFGDEPQEKQRHSPASGQAGGETAETSAQGATEPSALSKSGTKIAQRLAQLESSGAATPQMYKAMEEILNMAEQNNKQQQSHSNHDAVRNAIENDD